MKFRFSGCDIEISVLFTSLVCCLLLFDKTGLMTVGLLSAAIHESGHFIALALCRRRPDKIRFCAYGIIIKKNVNTLPPSAQMKVFLGGCAANLSAAAVFTAAYFAVPSLEFVCFGFANLFTALFSALPIYGLDGYDILNLILSKKKDPIAAAKTAKIISVAVTAMPIFGCITLIFFGKMSINLLITSLYLVILLIFGLF